MLFRFRSAADFSKANPILRLRICFQGQIAGSRGKSHGVQAGEWSISSGLVRSEHKFSTSILFLAQSIHVCLTLTDSVNHPQKSLLIEYFSITVQ
jgi:hypothetical protein